MDKILLPFRQNKLLNRLFLSNVFISYHYALVIYLNSSYLSKFFNESQISYLYILGSIISSFLLLNASKILERLTNYKFAVYGIILEFLAIFGMLIANTPFLMAIYFMLHLSIISLLLFNMDVFVESVTMDESVTGSIRGAYLTITNTMIVLAPLSISFLVKNNNYSYVYILSAFLMIPLYLCIKKFRDVKEVEIKHIKVSDTINTYSSNKDLYNIFICHTLLQLFYGFMVIYTPLYLVNHIGFQWSEIGIIFTIMLLPFVIFELPVGELEDGVYGEKEFLTIGFIIMGIATLIISFITTKNFWLWATILFISRIGASFVEISSESYFFKKVNKTETDIVGVFRMSRPLALIISPIMATLFLGFLPFQYIFIAIGTTMILGARYSLSLNPIKTSQKT